jgi:hypothetical protein
MLQLLYPLEKNTWYPVIGDQVSLKADLDVVIHISDFTVLAHDFLTIGAKVSVN